MMQDCDKNDHPCHTIDLPRLNRISGQLSGVKKMIEEERYCPDILTQLRAIRSAIKGLEANILERHLNHCIAEGLNTDDPSNVQHKIDELKDLFKRYHD
jgi:DNA-binding FrmR family transcriptional regulator